MQAPGLMPPAPWHGPPGPGTGWCRTGDGLRLRIALWPGGSRGTVLLFPGRTEYVEKYAATAATLTGAGYCVIAPDWRGQGLSDRLAQPATMGHVHRFADYQRDVDALLATARDADLPAPWHLLAHSMGGTIGLRALHRRLPVASAAFCAPMWGIALPRNRLAQAWILATAARVLHLDARFAPGEGPDSYAATAPFEGNSLTSDRDSFLATRALLRAQPDLALGGVSLGWIGAALWEARALARLPAPDLPAIAFLGQEETVVDPSAIRRRMADWPRGTLVDLPGARHELLMESPQTRETVLAQTIALFAKAAT